MTYTIKRVELRRIYLDNENPRHDPIKNEPEIIAHLIANEGVKPLARHIAEAGGTSPLERIAVVAHPKVNGAYIAAEGNRRVCAIKLLFDPDKADSESNKKYFRSLASRMTNRPSELEAVVFESMDLARPWVSLRHEGEQGGIGTKAWNPEQKARFSAKGISSPNANIQAMLLLDYARENNLLDSQEIAQLSITTLTRFLSNPVFRDLLGLTDNKTLTIQVPVEEFRRVITRFLTDALNTSSGVHSRTSVVDRKAYAERLRADNVAPVTRGRPLLDLNASPSIPSPLAEKLTPTSSVTRNNPSPDDRRKIIPRGFTARIHHKTLKRLYDELRSLDAEEFSFAATYLLRAVIEQMATQLLQQEGIAIPRELNSKLAEVAEVLKRQGLKDRQLKALRTMASDKNSRYSPDTIGHFVHGGAIPTRVDAIKTWDSIEPIITVVLAQLK